MKPEKILLFVLVLTISLKTLSQDTISLTVVEKSPVYYKAATDTTFIMFFAAKGEKVRAICRYGEYQVKFQNGQIGWLDKLSFAENRKMCVADTFEIYSEPDFRKQIAFVFAPGDTLYYKKTDKSNVFAYATNANKVGAWVSVYQFKPYLHDSIKHYSEQTAIYAHQNFIDKAKKTRYEELTEAYGIPTSVYIKGDIKRVYFSDFIIVKNAAHYKGIFLFYNSSGFVSDSLTGNSQALWFEKLPMAPLFRNISLGTGLNIGNLPLFVYLGELADDSTILKVLFTILKFGILALFFILPVYLAKYTYPWISKFRPLPNLVVKWLNYITFLAFYYVYFLFMLIQIFYPMPIFFTIGMLISFVYGYRRADITGFNHEMIDRNRCRKCHKLNTLAIEYLENTDKIHTTRTFSWREYLGSSTKTSYSGNNKTIITTNYYQNRSQTYPITISHFKDHLKCDDCGHQIIITRSTESPGHV